ncbi:CP4-57 regulatory protein AlpA [Micromonospora sp. M71_S20]|uniref:helix-turn-helix transcriptional regulator n=1 Tax=Micromonospora sp. M71_S20 TaxID=592872 RepID=UPI000EB47A19|nr:helix-turn-helix domain-containing protein [Micromonospora sp. M71_S20]RLK22617.1 CP4-57 regulatory protein AlpA [Micromonospora sp. M71_S20]
MPQHLYGTGEIQQRLGVSRERVRQLVQRPDFPRPYDVLRMGTVWRIEDVEAWIREYRPHLAEEGGEAL